MKFAVISTLCLSCSSVFAFAMAPAHAICTMTDVSLQVAVHGSQTPTQQNNQVWMGAQGPCWGNTTTNTATQVYVGSGSAQQERQSTHFIQGSPANPGGLSGPVIGTQIHVPVDVYSPAHDPSFMSPLGIGF